MALACRNAHEISLSIIFQSARPLSGRMGPVADTSQKFASIQVSLPLCPTLGHREVAISESAARESLPFPLVLASTIPHQSLHFVAR